MKFTTEQLNSALDEDPFKPYRLVDLLMREYPNTYDQGVDVWEKYTLRQHTIMVMNQFEKYFAHNPLPAKIQNRYFRLFLAVHDLGKPRAIANGGKHLQHQYTRKMIENLFAKLEIDQLHTAIALALASGDPLGKYIRGKLSAAEAKNIISNNAKTTTLSYSDYLAILIVFFKVDAGSYTEDAGGKKSLDNKFNFDPQNRKLDFAEDVEEKVNLLH